LLKKFAALGAECAEYLKAARTSEGELLFLHCLSCTHFLACCLTFFFPPCCLADALVIANARISSLEAKLSVARKAFDVATAAKVSAEKSNKSALTKAKKVEKALADTKKEHLQREQAVAERLNTMSAAAAAGIYYIFLLFCYCFTFFLLLTDIFLFCCFLFPWSYRTHQGVFVDFATKQ
jgi:hypothetical protein